MVQDTTKSNYFKLFNYFKQKTTVNYWGDGEVLLPSLPQPLLVSTELQPAPEDFSMPR